MFVQDLARHAQVSDSNDVAHRDHFAANARESSAALGRFLERTAEAIASLSFLISRIRRASRMD